MKDFADLIEVLDKTTKTNEKVEALAHYFERASDKDKVWVIALLSGRRPPRAVNATLLREWAAEIAGIETWLFEETYHIVGDLAETIALLVSSTGHSSAEKTPSLSEILESLIPLKGLDEAQKKTFVCGYWDQFDYLSCFAFNKFFTGGFRLGVSQRLMTKALEKYTQIEADEIALKLMGDWDPQSVSFESLVLAENSEAKEAKPYPFYLAYALEGAFSALGEVNQWAIEHKWDGIRAQLVYRNDSVYLWSRGEELINAQFPELLSLGQLLPASCVLDGELLAFEDKNPLPFSALQKRLGRKKSSEKLRAEIPVVFMAYDLLEYQGVDLRTQPYSERRERLEGFSFGGLLQLSERIMPKHWSQVEEEKACAKEKGSEGLMLKKLDSPYRVGRKKGEWFKSKLDPMTVDAVLTYAMRGHGRRSNLYTDFTFGLWQMSTENKPELVTFAKAYSGLTDSEFAEVNQWIKKNTIARFGPVRQLNAELVFEIAFEGISTSSRHKSGYATRFPRILRWRKDKTVEQANHLSDLEALIRS